MLHGTHEHLMTNPKSAHFTKHDDTKVMGTVTDTKVEATGESCGGTSQPTPVTPAPVAPVTPAPVTPAPVVPAPVAPVTPAPITPAPVTPPTQGAANVLPATQGSPIATPTQSSSGVLGANATIVKPKSTPAGGVLGTVTNVAGSTLPFTGFPVWVALLIALGLIAAGAVVWRRGSSNTATRV